MSRGICRKCAIAENIKMIVIDNTFWTGNIHIRNSCRIGSDINNTGRVIQQSDRIASRRANIDLISIDLNGSVIENAECIFCAGRSRVYNNGRIWKNVQGDIIPNRRDFKRGPHGTGGQGYVSASDIYSSVIQDAIRGFCSRSGERKYAINIQCALIMDTDKLISGNVIRKAQIASGINLKSCPAVHKQRNIIENKSTGNRDCIFNCDHRTRCGSINGEQFRGNRNRSGQYSIGWIRCVVKVDRNGIESCRKGINRI